MKYLFLLILAASCSHGPKWCMVAEGLPKDGQIIVYCKRKAEIGQVGQYCGKEDPAPFSTYWIPWGEDIYWLPMPELPNE